MRLNELRDNPGAKRGKKRLGRGIGSGLGKTSGKGHKGQKARAGGASAIFEGGQMPIYRRLPKRGFNNHVFRTAYQLVNLDRLQAAVEAGKLDAAQPIDVAVLVRAGLVRTTKEPVKLLGRGELGVALTLEVAKASPRAVAAVTAAGGSVNVLESVSETGEAEASPVA
ncbi:MAG: 50S ribosomal protein L15 [Geminicoccaceae bacterium]|nr:MAG: 50S ribosomal protein L15 [Geminicoccaceae bacterium]